MNLKMELEEHVSSGAFKWIDGQMRIIGKLGQISLIHNMYDIWLITPELEPLSERKLTFILKKFPQKLEYTRLNGEVWAHTRDKRLVLDVLSLLKIRKRKIITKDESMKLANRFKKKGY